MGVAEGLVVDVRDVGVTVGDESRTTSKQLCTKKEGVGY